MERSKRLFQDALEKSLGLDIPQRLSKKRVAELAPRALHISLSVVSALGQTCVADTVRWSCVHIVGVDS